jgi:hypothetical protein
MPEPIVKTFDLADDQKIEIVFTPLPVGEIAAHPLIVAAHMSKAARGTIAGEAEAAWVVACAQFEDPTPAGIVVLFKERPWENVLTKETHRWPFLQPRGQVNKKIEAPGALVLKDGSLTLFEKPDIDEAIPPLLHERAFTDPDPDPDDLTVLGWLSPHD